MGHINDLCCTQISGYDSLPKDSEWWQTLVEAVGNFIACDIQPLSVVENAGFKQLMYTAEPHFKAPS